MHIKIFTIKASVPRILIFFFIIYIIHAIYISNTTGVYGTFLWGEESQTTESELDESSKLPSEQVGNLPLSYDNATWSLVANGEVILPPKKAEGGYIVFSDGKLFTYFTNSGKKLYEKAVKCNKPQKFIVLENNFIAFISDNSTLTLLNSSGDTLWARQVTFLINDVIQGHDGRIFITGESTVSCFDITGRCRWNIETDPLKNTPIQQLNDGSIFLALESNDNNKSRVLRLSPFGQTLEIIDYDGSIVSALTTRSGVLLNFATGEFGLASIKTDNRGLIMDAKGEAVIVKAEIPWALKEKGNQNITKSTFVPITRDITALLIGAGSTTKVIFFWNESGNVVYSFTMGDNSIESIKIAASCMGGRGLFVADSRTATIFDITGSMSITKNMPLASDKIGNYNYSIYTNNDMLVLFCPSWLVAGFKMASIPRGRDNPFVKNAKGGLEKTDEVYSGFYSKLIYTYVDKAVIDEKDFKTLDAGLYGTAERNLSTRIFSAAKTYCDSLNIAGTKSKTHSDELIVNQVQTLYTPFIKQLFLLGGLKSITYIAHLIKTEKDPSNLRVIFKMTKYYPYDDEALMLKAIRLRVKTIPHADTTTLCALCDATGVICKYMGRRYAAVYGVGIVSQLLSNEYSDRVRATARKYLTQFTQ